MEEKRRFNGKTEEEALERAERALGIPRAELKFEVVSRSKGLLAVVKPSVVVEVVVEGLYDSPAEYSESMEELPPARAPRPPREESREPAEFDEERTPEEFALRVAKTKEFCAALLERLEYDPAQLVIREGTNSIEICATAELADAFQQDPEFVESFQFVVNKVVNRFPPRWKITVDGMSALSDKDLELLEKARRWIHKVEESGREMWLDRLNPRERRLVHMEVSKNSRVASKSEGEGRERRLCIYLAE